ncbi:MAG TPA: hypothetical protein VN699_06795 [Pirellulales bacterium]|nr:hypothetical protein [Pirellulales bacterium]
MPRRIQFSLRDLLEIQVLIGSGLGMISLTVWFWLRMPRWWVLPAVMLCAFGCFGAAIGVPVKQRLLFGIFGVVAWLVFCVGFSVLAPLL